MHALSPPDTGSKTRQQPTSLGQFRVFATAVTIEIAVATFVFDSPRVGPVYWLDPIQYVNTLAKVAIVAFCLLLMVLWPRRREIIGVYQRACEQSSAKHYLAANISLFLLLLAVRFVISQTDEPSASALIGYVALLFATGASVAFLAAPPEFWWKLPALAPIEVSLALLGGIFAVGFGYAAQEGWALLSSATLATSHWFLTLYETDVRLDAGKLLLGVGDFSVGIYGSCSGYEGIALIVTFLSIYMWVFRRELRFPNALLLLPLGISAIWILNSLRIAALVSLGAHVSPEIAVQGFHSQAGWISFLFVTLAIVAAARKVPFFILAQPHGQGSTARVARAGTDPSLAFLAPFMAMLAANIVAGAFAPHDEWLYGLKVVAIGATLWWFRDAYKSLIARVSWGAAAAGLAVGVAWIATDPGRGQETPLGAWIAAVPAWVLITWLALRLLGSVVLVPIAEELAFRGFFARWLISTRFETVSFGQFQLLAFAGSSIAFGLMHQRWLTACLAGAVYALLMYRTKRLSDPIAAHAVSNLAIVAWAVAARQWSLL